jgi:serine/threonine-protein kinase
VSHAKGILHRDLKPGNVLLAPQAGGRLRATIIDFGLARITGRSQHSTNGLLVGTATYVCPELLNGHTIGQQADLWSLGAMLYEMLAGRLPFDADNRERLFYMICYEDPAPVTRFNPGLPEEADRARQSAGGYGARHRDGEPQRRPP